MKTKKRSRLMVIFLSFLICMSLMPTTAFAAPGELEINEENFPDANFRAIIKQRYDKDKNGFFSQSELDKIKTLIFREQNVTTIKGVEHFKNLKLIRIGDHLTSLDVSKNPALTTLILPKNNLTALDVSKNPALKIIDCPGNNLTALDVSNNPKLTRIDLSGNQLTTLDVSKNPALTQLDCPGNQLTNLNVSNNPALTQINCSGNKLTSLELTSDAEITQFEGEDQQYDIEVDESKLTFDLSSLPGNFDQSKVKTCKGGNFSEDTLKIDSDKPSQVLYTYQVIPDKNLSVTLNVRYKEKLTVTFESNGGAGSMPEVFKNPGETYKLPECGFTAPDGKEFDKWEIEGVQKAVGDSITVKTNTTVKAIWKDKPVVTHTITFESNGGTGVMPKVTKNADETYTLPECEFTAPENQEFDTWEIDGKKVAPGTEIKIEKDTVVKATWKDIMVDIKFEPGEGSGNMDQETVKKGSAFKLPPSKFEAPENKEFKGWKIGDKEYAPNYEITVNEDTVVVAEWKDIKVNISYYANGGSGTMDEATLTKGSKYTVLPNAFTAPDENQEFDTWEIDGKKVAPGTEIKVEKDTVVKATWKDIMFDINFEPGEGSGNMDKETVKKGSTFKLPPSKFEAPENKEFKGWKIGDKEYAPNAEISVNENTVVVAEWKDIKVNVSYDANGGSGTMDGKTVNKGSIYELPECKFTAPEGKEFDKWAVGDVEKQVGDSITVNANTTVKAIWKDKPVIGNTSVMTINPSGGKWADGTTTPKTYTVEVGEYFTLPAAPIKDGYTFLYWKGSRYNPGDKYKVTCDDHTFTAVWQKKEVKPDNKGNTSSANTNKEVKTSPKTGDNTMMYIYALGLIMATCGMLILKARESKNNLK